MKLIKTKEFLIVAGYDTALYRLLIFKVDNAVWRSGIDLVERGVINQVRRNVWEYLRTRS
jgi:hypothetical protein